MARKANISGATVSRVLSGRTDISVSPETYEKVMKAAQELGYMPNSAARALTNGRTGLVGFWMSLEYSPYRGEVLEYMRILLRGTECALAVTDVDEEYNWAHSFDRALRVPVDGIIAFDNSASVEAFATQADSLAPLMPFVSMGAYWSEARSFVGVDLYKGAEKAMHHLLETGRRSIAYVAPWTSDLINSGPRYDAYVAGMEAAGLPSQTIGIQTSTFGAIRESLDETIEQGQLPEALLCMNDEIALAAATALEKRGLHVGRDVAIVGFNGMRESATAPVPITTVRQPIEEMCTLAWKFIEAQMKDPKAPLQQKILIPELVVRESSAP